MYFLCEKKERCGVPLVAEQQQADILSVSVKVLSNGCRAAGGAGICSSPAARRRALPFTKPGDATHILFVLHEQTDCKLADNFRTDNVIYGCQPFVGLCLLYSNMNRVDLPLQRSLLH